MPQNQRKRIFLNLDGTGQSEYTLEPLKTKNGTKTMLTSPPVSNIARIGRATVTDDERHGFQQIVYYLAGVGASSEDSWLAQGYQGFTGAGLLQNVREAYGFLCNNYDYEDEIYITGFSRGAFTARSVAGMVGKVGILTKKGLQKFYEAFDYYEDPKKWDKCPVSEDEGTTRRFTELDVKKAANEKTQISVKAVGVFDTVGALSGDWAFHDVSLGGHIENAFHALSLDEKRGYFSPTLWESFKPNGRELKNFEQCWMVGDHSNVGGSWDDQQLADISLAWMMSKYEGLGAKFDQSYLFDQYTDYKKFLIGETKNPNLLRQWGEGKCQAVKPYYTEALMSGTAVRSPKMYRQPKMTQNWLYQTVLDPKSGKLLQNTNETIHPSVRYRHFSQTKRELGTDDKGPYNPTALSDWNWPSGPASESQVYTRKDDATKSIGESTLGKYEEMLLALYDQDEQFKDPGTIWKQVLGSTAPSEATRQAIEELTGKQWNGEKWIGGQLVTG